MKSTNFDNGVLLTKSRDYSRAMKAFTAQIEQNPNDYSSYLNRGSIECCLGLDEFAIDDFTRVIELQPFEITGYYNRFIAYYKVGRKEEAQKDLYVALSLAYMRKGQQTKSVKLIGKALEIVENNAMAHIRRADMYKQQGKLELALNDYNGALEADANNITALKLRASIYRDLQQQQQSDEDLARVIELSSKPISYPSLLPVISKMTNAKIEQDIHIKVIEFTNISKQIYKGGYQHQTTTQTPPRIEENQEQNQLQTTIGRQTANNNNLKIKVIQSSNQRISLGQLDDFNESSNMTSNATTVNAISNVLVESKHSEILDKEAKQMIKQQINLDEPILKHQIQGIKEGSVGLIKFLQSKQDIKQIDNQVKEQETKQNLPSVSKSLQIFVESAILIHDTQWLGKMSPYVHVSYNGWQQTTQVLPSAGNKPVWNQSIKFIYNEDVQSIKIKIFDKQTYKNDDLIGQGYFSLKQILGNSILKLVYKKQLAAELKLNGSIKS